MANDTVLKTDNKFDLNLIATCMFGLEAVVVRELLALGYADAKSMGSGRIGFTGDMLAIARGEYVVALCGPCFD